MTAGLGTSTSANKIAEILVDVLDFTTFPGEAGAVMWSSVNACLTAVKPTGFHSWTLAWRSQL
jgi:hypothetical protein